MILGFRAGRLVGISYLGRGLLKNSMHRVSEMGRNMFKEFFKKLIKSGKWKEIHGHDPRWGWRGDRVQISRFSCFCSLSQDSVATVEI